MEYLPKKCQRYLANRGLPYEQLEEGAQKAIILRDFKLPQGKYDVAHADILIVLPAGFPDCAPDMFYALPWLRLNETRMYPRAADQAVVFQETPWQRWSRHNNDWRPGVDGIWTMLKRIEDALEVAG
ncbi:E2/UBC family protein [Herbaspirillum rubrisubalbicans]|uniref:E2 family protein E n=1 Tax=Herbaspirillum rubrisubalbicans TaxID=80842 RepID=A0AAD0XG81_9BURK|nr:E2/UBC family protein [Herbaspirillum rubrisubalbicans]AYR23404.1 hypothetical protein RC54_06000 [Herbaspirillum rubrisubalbicans]